MKITDFALVTGWSLEDILKACLFFSHLVKYLNLFCLSFKNFELNTVPGVLKNQHVRSPPEGMYSVQLGNSEFSAAQNFFMHCSYLPSQTGERIRKRYWLHKGTVSQKSLRW